MTHFDSDDDNMSPTHDKINKNDPITFDLIDPRRHITITSPDGTVTIAYNTSTLRRIAEKKGMWMQPPHFTEIMRADLRQQVEAIEGNLPHLHMTTAAAEEAMVDVDNSDNDDTGVHYYNEYFQSLVSRFNGRRNLERRNLFVCPRCYEVAANQLYCAARTDPDGSDSVCSDPDDHYSRRNNDPNQMKIGKGGTLLKPGEEQSNGQTACNVSCSSSSSNDNNNRSASSSSSSSGSTHYSVGEKEGEDQMEEENSGSSSSDEESSEDEGEDEEEEEETKKSNGKKRRRAKKKKKNKDDSDDNDVVEEAIAFFRQFTSKKQDVEPRRKKRREILRPYMAASKVYQRDKAEQTPQKMAKIAEKACNPVKVLNRIPLEQAAACCFRTARDLRDHIQRFHPKCRNQSPDENKIRDRVNDYVCRRIDNIRSAQHFWLRRHGYNRYLYNVLYHNLENYDLRRTLVDDTANDGQAMNEGVAGLDDDDFIDDNEIEEEDEEEEESASQESSSSSNHVDDMTQLRKKIRQKAANERQKKSQPIRRTKKTTPQKSKKKSRRYSSSNDNDRSTSGEDNESVDEKTKNRNSSHKGQTPSRVMKVADLEQRKQKGRRNIVDDEEMEIAKELGLLQEDECSDRRAREYNKSRINASSRPSSSAQVAETGRVMHNVDTSSTIFDKEESVTQTSSSSSSSISSSALFVKRSESQLKGPLDAWAGKMYSSPEKAKEAAASSPNKSINGASKSTEKLPSPIPAPKPKPTPKPKAKVSSKPRKEDDANDDFIDVDESSNNEPSSPSSEALSDEKDDDYKGTIENSKSRQTKAKPKGAKPSTPSKSRTVQRQTRASTKKQPPPKRKRSIHSSSEDKDTEESSENEEGEESESSASSFRPSTRGSSKVAEQPRMVSTRSTSASTQVMSAEPKSKPKQSVAQEKSSPQVEFATKRITRSSAASTSSSAPIRKVIKLACMQVDKEDDENELFINSQEEEARKLGLI